MSGIEVGDRVKSICHPAGTVLGLHVNHKGAEWAWVEWDDESDCYGCELFSLTRIEPDVPKYAVGQTVLTPGYMKVEIVEVEDSYRVRYPDGGEVWWRQSELEAVPEACPTCGKVADG
jgi:hypothetical protein